MTDLHFQEQGSVWLVHPITPRGEAWITDHTSVRAVRALRWFGAIEIDRRSQRTCVMARVQTGSMWGSTRPNWRSDL
jgi:hypothetical protein